jgi:hypothetical protein
LDRSGYECRAHNNVRCRIAGRQLRRRKRRPDLYQDCYHSGGRSFDTDKYIDKHSYGNGNSDEYTYKYAHGSSFKYANEHANTHADGDTHEYANGNANDSTVKYANSDINKHADGHTGRDAKPWLL